MGRFLGSKRSRPPRKTPRIAPLYVFPAKKIKSWPFKISSTLTVISLLWVSIGQFSYPVSLIVRSPPSSSSYWSSCHTMSHCWPALYFLVVSSLINFYLPTTHSVFFCWLALSCSVSLLLTSLLSFYGLSSPIQWRYTYCIGPLSTTMQLLVLKYFKNI